MARSASLRIGSLVGPGRSSVVRGIVYVLLYVALDRLSYVDPMGPLGVTAWNPPPALSLFMLIRFGLAVAPWLFAAAFSAHVVVRGFAVPWELIAAACMVLTAGYAIVGALLRRHLDPRNGIENPRDATLLTAIVVPGTLVIATVYVGLFVVSGTLGRDALVASVAQFWIGDLIGIVVMLPLLLAWAHPGRHARRRFGLESALQLASILVALWVVFGSGLGVELKLFYVLFLPVIWVAMRRGVPGTTVTTFLIQIGLIVALLYSGHRPGEILDFQVLMLTLAFTGLFLSVSVEERNRSDERLREKQFELDRTLRAAAASELASGLAHELNQPLSAIASYTRSCQLLLQGGDREGELPATLDKVVLESKRAALVVRRLREFVRSGTLEQRPIRPQDLLAAAAGAIRVRAQRHDVTVSVDATADLPAMLGDRVQLEIVLLNLTTNAIDALTSCRGERVLHLGATHVGEAIRLSVADTGPGVPPDRAADLFQPLNTTKPQGMGLGLAISRTIVEAHGGRLWLERAARGATFCLTVPLAHPQRWATDA